MAESARQKRITSRVMHGIEHGELKSGPSGKGGPVRSRKQAIAIALEEAARPNTRATAGTREIFAAPSGRKPRAGGQQEAEGSSHIGTANQRESTPAMGGMNATGPRARGRGGEGPRPCSRGPYARRTLRGSQTSQDRGPIQNDERSIGERPRTCAPYGARGWTCLEHGRQRPTVIHLGCSEHSPVPSGYDPSAKMPGRIGFPKVLSGNIMWDCIVFVA